MQIDVKKMSIIPTPPKNHTWEGLMALALDEAKKALEKKEVPVGAIIVNKEGEILASAYNRTINDCDPTAHAEIVALREAAKKVNNYRLKDCYLIVTLEPCIMCLGALHEARIEGIIFGAYDKKLGALTSRFEGLHLTSFPSTAWFMGGILEEECQRNLKDFFKAKR